jgi:phenylalanine-4-hydroxylase
VFGAPSAAERYDRNDEVSGLGETEERVPAHLRRFVVQQDYAAYTAVDHAVWRFVLLQMFDRLEHAAHPAYARGLARTGMSVDTIPRIDEMDARLRDYGWGAVCVDGFIPPRAFQEFQALGILPIAAEIRTVEHLPYTPAPDIIHEAAGHAPILPDPEYAAYLRRIGECGMRAFASERDAQLYQAIYRLSVVKEQRDPRPTEIADAELALQLVVSQHTEPSEATRLARLYWWTVEYGLVGSLQDHKLYGAGLLSSLGESYFCRDSAVRKLALSRDCIETDYDITRPQPQLFVARDFAQLQEVLDEVCSGMAFRSGGLCGLLTARDADEVATIELDSGMQLTGNVAQVLARDADADAELVTLRGECTIAERGRILAGHERAAYRDGLALVLGPLAGGVELSELSAEAFVRRFSVGADRRVRFELCSGRHVEGQIEGTLARPGEGLHLVALAHARVMQGEQPLYDDAAGRVILLAGRRVCSVRAGAADAGFWPAAAYPDKKTPARQPEDAQRRTLRVLYERAAQASEREGRAVQRSLGAVHAALRRDHPKEWLLRWNLLESLHALDVDPVRRLALVSELWQLEHWLEGKYPIAMGLRYLGYDEDPALLRARPASQR